MQWTPMYPPVEASGGQEQYDMSSALHLFAHFMFSSCRGKSYIGIWITDMSSWTLSSFISIELCCCCCCYCFMLLLLFICNCGYTNTHEQQQQNYTVTIQIIRTKRLNNLCILIFLLLLLLLLLLCNFVSVHLELWMHNDRWTATSWIQ